MTDAELLEQYRQTRLLMLQACGYGSTADKATRLATFHEHLRTVDLIRARFPGIPYPHSTAECYLRDAIASAQPNAEAGPTC